MDAIKLFITTNNGKMFNLKDFANTPEIVLSEIHISFIYLPNQIPVLSRKSLINALLSPCVKRGNSHSVLRWVYSLMYSSINDR